MLLALISFLICFILLNLVSSTLIYLSFKPSNEKLDVIQMVKFLGIGPVAITWTLHVLLVLFQFPKGYFPLAIIGALLIFLIYYNRKYVIHLQQKLRYLVSKISIYSKENITYKNLKIEFKAGTQISFIALINILFLYFFIDNWQSCVLNNKIIGHDVSIYAVFGRIISENLHFSYNPIYFDINSSFYYYGQHGFAFPWIATLEHLVSNLFGIETDFYFKSITGYYGLLLIIVCYTESKKYFNVYYAYLFLLMLFLSISFWKSLSNFHIDSMRYYFIVLSFILFISALKSKNNNKTLFFVVLGLSAWVHSINAIFSILIIAMYLILKFQPSRKYYLHGLTAITIFMFSGFAHYIIDILIGTGWILKSVIR